MIRSFPSPRACFEQLDDNDFEALARMADRLQGCRGAAPDPPRLPAHGGPTEVRCTGIGVAYNISIGLLGGTAPLIVTYLVARTGDHFAPVYYVMGAAVVSLVSLLGLPETARQPAT